MLLQQYLMIYHQLLFMRNQHQAEQQAELSYRMAMDETTDPTLRELYRELTEGCQNHCRQLRALLEQSCT